jgi:hypothetical protein
MGAVSLCSAPMVKVPKASGLEDGDGSGEGEGEGEGEVEGEGEGEDGVGEGDNSRSGSLDREGAVMSSR